MQVLKFDARRSQGHDQYHKPKLSVAELDLISSHCCLQQLHFHNCSVQSLWPLTKLAHLSALSLSSCDLAVPLTTSAIPLTTSAMPRLGAEGSGELSDPLSPVSLLTNLQHLVLRWCFPVLDGSLVFLSGLVLLQSLDLSKCKYITGSGLAHLSHLTGLQQLNLEGCSQLTAVGMAQLALLTNLQQLQMKDANIAMPNQRAIRVPLYLDPSRPPISLGHQLSNLQALRCLTLGAEGIHVEVDPHLIQLPSLSRLVLCGSAPYVPTLRHLADMHGLDSLELQSRTCPTYVKLRVTGQDIALFAGLPSLRHLDLDLYECEPTDGNLMLLERHSSSLTHLELSLSEVTHDGLAYMCDTFTQLRSLVLNTIRLEGDLWSQQLSRFSLLQSLTLQRRSWRCNLRDEDIQHLSALTGLTQLVLGRCAVVTPATLQPLFTLKSLAHLKLEYENTRLPAGAAAPAMGAIDHAVTHIPPGASPAPSRDPSGWSLAPMAQLTRLELNEFLHESTLNAHLAPLTALKHLTLNTEAFAFHAPPLDLEILSSLSCLTGLNLRGRTLGDCTWMGLAQLQKLTLDCNDRAGEGIWRHLSRLSRLAVLEVVFCSSATFLADVAHVTGLQKLAVLRCAGITDAALAPSTALCMLRKLSMHGCFQTTAAGLRG